LINKFSNKISNKVDIWNGMKVDDVMTCGSTTK